MNVNVFHFYPNLLFELNLHLLHTILNTVYDALTNIST